MDNISLNSNITSCLFVPLSNTLIFPPARIYLVVTFKRQNIKIYTIKVLLEFVLISQVPCLKITVKKQIKIYTQDVNFKKSFLSISFI